MRIVHISTWDVVGGAALAAFRLHRGLAALGGQSCMYVERKTCADPSVTAFAAPMDLWSRARRRWRRRALARDAARYQGSRPAGGELFSDDRSLYGASVARQLPPCDAVNLHWVAGFVDPGSFFGNLAGGTAVVWTLHDMNPLTGGCHYDMGCGRFSERCGSCPQLGSERADDLSRQVWRRKSAAFRQLAPQGLHLVAPSRWMAAQCARSSLLGRFRVRVIPNGVDEELFAPRDRAASRSVLNIPQDARVLLFVAHSADSKRKGFQLLEGAWARLRTLDKLFILTAGARPAGLEDVLPHLHLGYVQNERMLSIAYSAADLLVIPSLQDNLPNTVLESLACGTPAVGFDVGGIPDMVRPGLTGWLAPAGDVEALCRTVTDALTHMPQRAAISANCRRVVLQEYTLAHQAQRYKELYEEILVAQGGRP